MSEMTIAVIVVSASCHHLTRADSGWSRISWFSRVTLPWLRGGTSAAPRRHKSSHVPVFRRLFDRLPVRISTSDLHHRILRKKLYHIRAYDFGVQFSFKPCTVFFFCCYGANRQDWPQWLRPAKIVSFELATCYGMVIKLLGNQQKLLYCSFWILKSRWSRDL